MKLSEHYLTDYQSEDGVRVVIYVPPHIPQIQPSRTMDAILSAMISTAEVVRGEVFGKTVSVPRD